MTVKVNIGDDPPPGRGRIDLADPDLYAAAENHYGLPSGLLYAVAKRESTFNPKAYNKGSKAAGLMQFIPSTAKDYGVDVSDPVSSIDGAARMYSDLLKQYDGDLPKALAGYNYGSGNLAKSGMDRLPKETRDYIVDITATMGRGKNPQYAENNVPQEVMNDAGKRPLRINIGDDNAQQSEGDKIKAILAKRDEATRIKNILAKKNGNTGDAGDSEAQTQTGIPEAAANAFVKGLTFNFKDELQGYGGAAYDKITGNPKPYSELKDQRLEAARARDELLETEHPVASVAGNVAGAALPIMFTGGAAAPALGAGMLARAGGLAASGARQGLVAGFGAGKDDFAGRVSSAETEGVMGAIAAPAIDAGLSGLKTGATKLYNSGRNILSPQGQAANAIDQQAQSLGFNPLTYTESVGVKNAPNAGKAETALENTPLIGTAGQRASDQRAAAEVANNLKENAKKQAVDTFKNADISDIEAAAADPYHPRYEAANYVKNIIDSSNDDFKDILKASGNLTYLRRSMIADAKYKEAAKEAKGFFTQPTNIVKEINRAERKTANEAVVYDSDLLKKIQKLKSTLQNDNGGYADLAKLRETQTNIEEMRYKDGKRIDLGKFGRVLDRINAAAGKDIRNLLANPMQRKRVAVPQPSVPSVIIGLSKPVPPIYETKLVPLKGSDAKLQSARQKYEDADKYYKEAMVPYKDAQIAKMINEGDSGTVDRIMEGFYGGKDQTGDNLRRAKKIYGALDESGRDAARLGFFHNAIENSKSARGDFVPIKFAKQLEENKELREVLFPGGDNIRLDGIKNIMNRLERVSQFTENPPTGNRFSNIYSNIISGGAGAIGAGAGMVAGIKGLAVTAGLAVAAGSVAKFLFTTPAGKKFLYASGKLSETDPKLDNIINQVINLTAKTGARELSDKAGTK